MMLKISNVETFYGKIQALRGVNIDINKGEIVSLIGSNGAGKSTLLMTISGVNKAKTGEIIFEGKNIEKYEPHDIVDLGIAQAPEGRRIFSRLTVEENLRLGAHANEKGKFFDIDVKDIYDLFPVLSDRKSQRGGTLSGGEQQMLAIGRALMNRPKVLLLDEPSLGIAPKLVNQIFLAIKNINKEKKVTIFLVEQNAKKALELADRAYVLVNGKVTIQGTGQELLKNQDIQAAYLEGGAKS
jgi:branched-chain amino acid transport system ATP-binding protein